MWKCNSKYCEEVCESHEYSEKVTVSNIKTLLSEEDKKIPDEHIETFVRLCNDYDIQFTEMVCPYCGESDMRYLDGLR